MIPVFTGQVKQGQLILSNRKMFDHYLTSLNGEVDVRVGKRKRTRSEQQNNLYWLYLEIIDKETGQGKNELHEYFRLKYISPTFITVFGQVVETRKSTTKLSTKEMSDYLLKIEIETGIPVPDIWSIDV